MIDVHQVTTRDDLAAYLEELAADIRGGRHPHENTTSASLIDGASGWVADMDGWFANRGEEMPPEPTWRLIAYIFTASLVYE